MTPLDPTLLDALSGRVSGEVLADDLTRAMYSTGAGLYQLLPLGVVRPLDREDLVRALAWARENGVSVTLRGAGTGAADGCLGTGLIVDLSCHMGRETEIDVHEDTVTVPAGATYAAVNKALAPFGRHLPPDPPTGDYATIGGLIATNASGVTTVRHGAIVDAVESLELVLADGTVLETTRADVRQAAFKEHMAGEGREPALYRHVYDLLREHRGLVRSRTPDLRANASGYRVERALRRGVIDLAPLLAGSEGTFGAVTRATLRTVERPAVSGAILFYFETPQLAADSVRPLLDMEPCSVEMADARSLEPVRVHRPDLAHFLREKAQTVLIVEFDGEDNDEVIPKLLETQRLLADEGGPALDSVLATAEPDVDEARALRKAALHVLPRPGDARRPARFVDDLAVPPDMVSSCVHGLTEVMRRHGVDVVLGGHVGHGHLSARPLLDLKDGEDIRRMREIAEEVFGMVVDMGGTLSSGNGDGRPRTEFLRLQYGDLCDVFAQLKSAFDPDGLLNPGVKVGGERGTLVSNLRHGGEPFPRPVSPVLIYDDETLDEAVGRCHGCGACRALSEEVAMCPVYKALEVEEAAPRAKANILRHLLTNPGVLPPEDELVADLTRLTDLCLNCHMCSVECPSGMDVARLMVELRARRAERGGLARDEKLAKLWPRLLPMLATFPALGNFVMRNRFFRYLGERVFGLAARREIPRFRPLEARGRHKPTLTRAREHVVYFTGADVDCCHPEVSRCTLDVLIRNGAEVEVMSGTETGAERMVYGDVAGARKVVEKNVRKLAPLVDEGFRVVSTDPAVTLFFREYMLRCTDTPEARAVAGAAFDLMQFLLSLHRAGRLDTRFRAVPVPLAYHAPCHLRALRIGRPALELLRLVPELPVLDLNAGCCGMAETFGLRRKNFELSMLIGRPLFERLKGLDVRYGLTECGACAMQLQQGSGKRVLHPIQVLHRAYGLPEEGMESW